LIRKKKFKKVWFKKNLGLKKIAGLRQGNLSSKFFSGPIKFLV